MFNNTTESTEAPKKSLGLFLTRQGLSLIIFLGNCIILAAISKSKRMKPTTVRLVACLASSDLLFGIVLFVRSIIVFVTTLSETQCLVALGLIIASGGMSVTSIFLLSLDMFLGVKYMTTTKKVLTLNMVYVMIGLTWTIWIAIGLGAFFFPSADNGTEKRCLFVGGYIDDKYLFAIVIIAFSLMVPIISLEVATTLRLVAFRKEILSKGVIKGLKTKFAPKEGGNQGHCRIARAGNGNAAPVQSSSVYVHTEHQHSACQESTQGVSFIHKQWLKTTRSVNNIVILLLALFTCTWVVYFLMVFLYFVCPKCVSIGIITSIGPLPALGGMGNVFIFAVKNSEFRAIVKNIVTCRRGENAVVPLPSITQPQA